MNYLKIIIILISIGVVSVCYATPMVIVNNIPNINTITPTTLKPSDITDANSIVTINANITISSLKSTTGTRYLCINSVGSISSSASACSGT